MLDYCEMLTPETLFVKHAIQTVTPLGASQDREVSEKEEYCNRLAGALIPFANNKSRVSVCWFTT